MVRSPNKPLQQIVKRLIEIDCSQFDGLLSDEKQASYYYSYYSGPVSNESAYKCYKKVKFNGLTLCVEAHRKADCYCVTKNRKVFKILNVLKNSDWRLFFYGREFLSYEPFYDYPFSSTTIDIFKVKELSDLKTVALDVVLTKCVLIPNENDLSYVSIPLLHAL